MPDWVQQRIGLVRDWAADQPVQTPEQIRALLTTLASGEAVAWEFDDGTFPLDLPEIQGAVPLVTFALHLAHPEVFVPYAFTQRHWVFERIASEFGLALPPVAAKNDHLGRWLYYQGYCAALQDFRVQRGMSVPELLAFLNDFATNYVSPGDAELPLPSRAWIMVGGPEEDGDYGLLQNLAPEDQTFWQGTLDMQRGDVCVMHIRSPVSAVSFLMRVMVDGYVDPFFHYKHAVQIGQVVRTPPLPFKEMAAGPVMGASSHIKRNLQGVSGQPLSREEYEEIIAALVRKGLDPALVPQLPDVPQVDLADLNNERDVERLLVEPLLLRVGLHESDWIRQLPVRMGRGERNYPDYVLHVTGTFPEQRAHALVEAKYRLAGERDWQEAFWQAKSYALRLGAQAMVVAAVDGLRLYRRVHDDFDFKRGEALTWQDVQEGPSVLELARVLGNRTGRK